ncbi:MAG: hypothetical protein MJ252_27600, partial [archaeon]|nr:hypothetical protein [archaeon]
MDKTNKRTVSEENRNNIEEFKKFILNYKLDELSHKVLKSISNSLSLIYRYYFLYEVGNYKDKEQIVKNSYNHLYKLGMDLRIVPYMFTKLQMEVYYPLILETDIENLVNNPDIKYDYEKIGVIYTFDKFMLFFGHLSSLYYYSYKGKSNAEKILYLIERIYRGESMNTVIKKTALTFNHRLTLIPPKEIVEMVNPKLTKNTPIEQRRKGRVDQTMEGDEDETQWKKNLKKTMGINDDNCKKLERFIEDLRNYFTVYSKYGDKFIYGRLLFSNFEKMLVDGGLLWFKNEDLLNKSATFKKKRNLSVGNEDNNGKNNFYSTYGQGLNVTSNINTNTNNMMMTNNLMSNNNATNEPNNNATNEMNNNATNEPIKEPIQNNFESAGPPRVGMNKSKSNADLTVNQNLYLSKSQSQGNIHELSKQRSNMDYRKN